MLIWPDASKAQNSIAAVSADGRTVCVLIRRLNSSCSRSMALVVRNVAPLARRQPRKGEEPIAGLLQAVGDGFVLEPLFAHEGLASRRDLFVRRRVDHVVVVGGDLSRASARARRPGGCDACGPCSAEPARCPTRRRLPPRARPRRTVRYRRRLNPHRKELESPRLWLLCAAGGLPKATRSDLPGGSSPNLLAAADDCMSSTAQSQKLVTVLPSTFPGTLEPAGR